MTLLQHDHIWVKLKGQVHRSKCMVTWWKWFLFHHLFSSIVLNWSLLFTRSQPSLLLRKPISCQCIRLVVCRVLCAKVVGATSSEGFQADVCVHQSHYFVHWEFLINVQTRKHPESSKNPRISIECGDADKLWRIKFLYIPMHVDVTSKSSLKFVTCSKALHSRPTLNFWQSFNSS